MRTRSALVTAAREVFESDGFLDARISDISKAAGVASGSFYTYFDSKEEIFAAVVEQVREEMLHPHIRERVGIDDPRELIAAANREYLLSYRRNARLMAVLEQVSKIDEKFRVLRFERALAFVERNAEMIRNLQDRGLVDAELDAEVTSLALSSMVSRMAYFVFVEGRKVSFEKLVKTLNQLWFNALQLKEAH
ncbi:TetR/AcrR family transcriptional regulator [Nocardia vinacea]|uniref:TetR/AcrR family transcriptional regulator n=1 Tax=Nocardia vinacea TaxID=96468 RepID=A0ABZ1Z705_9NOCA|nr:TetR/AcrR family transcriptional regulator [Nocardia vinacea]